MLLVYGERKTKAHNLILCLESKKGGEWLKIKKIIGIIKCASKRNE